MNNLCFFCLFPICQAKKILKNHLHSKKKNKRFSTTFEVKNASFFQKTDANASQKKVNGDFSILNGDFSVQIFQKRFQLFF